MELRLKSKESEETIRIEISDECTLHNLKQALIQTLGSSLPADSLHLSLNRNDELQESSPADSLPYLGIASGDLAFFTFNPSEFSNQEGASIQSSLQVEENQIEQSQSIDLDLEKLRLENFESIGVVLKNCPKSILLSRVMKEELGHGSNAHKLLVIVVHAVLLEFGFVPIDRLDMSEDWPSPWFSISNRYTLPEPYTMNEVVSLKFQSSEHFVIVNESLDCRRGSNVYRVTLDVRTFAPNLDSIWVDSMSSNKIIDEKEWNNIEVKMCESWKVVKDDLVLPIFMILPSDMMLKIMEALSGVDIGKLQCVCTELRDLGNNNNLWRLKFNQEFPWEEDFDPENEHWKPKFEECYKNMMNLIAINMEHEPPQPDFVHGRGYGVWQNYRPPPPWHYPFARVPFQHAFRPYHLWRGRNAFNPHLGWQWRGRGRNAFNPHHGWQGR